MAKLQREQQHVSVLISYDAEEICIDTKANGESVVRVPQIASISIYGPFKSRKAAKADAKIMEEMNDGKVFVARIYSPEDQEEE